MSRSAFKKARRIVVKVGTSLLAPPTGGVHARRFSDLADDICTLPGDKREVILVSSGAVGLGTRRQGTHKRPVSIPDKQAAAAIGQIDLCRRYEKAFARHDRLVGQILLTHAGLADRERFLNARRTLNALLRAKVVPIVNENDSVATEELRFSDNDLLSALVVNISSADLLIILTDVDGVYDRPPSETGATRVSELTEITSELLEQMGEPGSTLGTGGMRAKLEGARAASRFGVPTVIASGLTRGTLAEIVAGEDIGTYVSASENLLSSRKHWIAFSLKPCGKLHLDAGAVTAVCERGRSLLPSGITQVEGDFRVGDPVACISEQGKEIARGLIAYTAKDLALIQGQQSARIHALLGYSNGNDVIHRDDLVVL